MAGIIICSAYENRKVGAKVPPRPTTAAEADKAAPKESTKSSKADKLLLLTSVALTALSFESSLSLITDISLRSISLISTIATLATTKTRDRKFLFKSLGLLAAVASIIKISKVLGTSATPYLTLGGAGFGTICKLGALPWDKKSLFKALQVLTVFVSLCGSMGLGGTQYATWIAVGALALCILCKIALLALEEAHEEGWQKAASIVISLLTLGSMIFNANNLEITATIVNFVVMGYILYVTFQEKNTKDYFEDMCNSALWIMNGISLAKQYEFL